MSKHILPLIPSGLLVQQVVPSADTVTITTAPKALESCCPVCGHASRRAGTSEPWPICPGKGVPC